MKKPCLKPHPKFELILRCKDTYEVVRTWQLRMVADTEGEYPEREDFLEAMDIYHRNLPCDCVNCNEGEG